MANVGNKTLSTEVAESITKQLIDSFTGSNKNFTRSLVHELLSETEQRMLAKRLAAVLMLITDQSYYRIHQVLGMSTSTIKNLHKQLITGEYAEIEKHVLHRYARTDFEKKIGLILRCGLPPRSYVIKKRSSTNSRKNSR